MIGQRATVRHARGFDLPEAGALEPLEELVEEPGFPGARLARDHHDGTRTGKRALGGGGKARQLSHAADKWGESARTRDVEPRPTVELPDQEKSPHRFVLALDHEFAEVLELEEALGGLEGPVAQHDLPRLGYAEEARGDVHRIAQ